MTKSIELIKDLGARLKSDISNEAFRDGSGDLNYIMSLRFQDAVITAGKSAGITDFDVLLGIGSDASRSFIQGIIDLSETYA